MARISIKELALKQSMNPSLSRLRQKGWVMAPIDEFDQSEGAFDREFIHPGHEICGERAQTVDQLNALLNTHFADGKQAIKRHYSQVLYSLLSDCLRDAGLYVSNDTEKTLRLTKEGSGVHQKDFFEIAYSNLKVTDGPFGQEKIYAGETRLVFKRSSAGWKLHALEANDEIIKHLTDNTFYAMKNDLVKYETFLNKKIANIDNLHASLKISKANTEKRKAALTKTRNAVTALSNDLTVTNMNDRQHLNNLNIIKNSRFQPSGRLLKNVTHVVCAIATLGIYGLVRGLQRGSLCFWKTRKQLMIEKVESQQNKLRPLS